MFFENMFLGVLALIIGLPLGTFLSTFFLKMLTAFIKSSVPIKYNFDIRSLACTFCIFMIIFILNSVKSYNVIYKFTLVELLHAENEGEKQPQFSTKLAIASAVMMVTGYIIALTLDLNVSVEEESKLIYKGILILILNIAGTYLLFNNLITYVFNLLKKNKKFYYKGEHLIGISGLVYRIKSNSNLLATIVIILSVAITSVCFTFSLNMTLDQIIPNGAPFSVTYKSGNEDLDKKVENIINSDGSDNITYKTSITAVNAKGLTKNYTNSKSSEIPFDMYVISLSEYNEILEKSYFNKSSDISQRATDIKIDNDNDCFFIEVSKLAEGRGRLTGNTLNAYFAGKEQDIGISDSDVKGVLGINFQKPTAVVRDNFFDDLVKQNKDNLTVIRAYNFDNPLKNQEIVNNISKIMPDNSKFYSYYNVYISLHTLYGCFTFIGAFIGILFVFSIGSIMYYKQLIEAEEDKSRFVILSKIGFTRKETFRIIMRQIGFIFILPLALAVINSSIVLWDYVKYIANGGSTSLFVIKCIDGVMGIYVLIYLMYYLLCVKSYSKIVRRAK